MPAKESSATLSAAEKLEHQRELLDRVFENVPVLLVMWDPKFERFTLNRYAETVLGWTADEIQDGDLMTKVYPDPALRRKVAVYMESLEKGWRKWIGTTKSGERVPIDWANIRLTDDTMIGIGVDLREHERAEEALRQVNEELEQRVEERTAQFAESEARFRAIFEKARDGIILADVHTRMFHFANRAACEMLGYSEEELRGMGVADIHPEVEMRRVADAFERQVCGELSLASDIPLKRCDGEVIYVDVNSFPLLVDGRKYLAGFFRDVTERRRDKEALASTGAKYRGLVENTLDVPCCLDAVGKIVYVGPQVKYYGFDPSDLEGRFFLDVVFPEDRERMAADFERTLREGRTFPSEFRILAPDGVVYWFEERSTVQRDASGTVMALTGVLRDVTERKEAEVREQAMIQRLQAFEAAVNQGPAVLFRWRVVPGEWPVEMVTANVKQFGYEPDDFTSGRVSWPGITHPDDVPGLEEQVNAHLEKGVREFHQRYRLITKAGAVRYVEDWNTVLIGPDGSPAHIQAIVMDVTQLWEEEQRRRESEEKYRSLCGNIPGMIYCAMADWSVGLIMNSEMLCGYSSDEFSSGEINWRDLIHPGDRQRVLDEMSRLSGKPASVVQEYRVITKAGQLKWVSDHKTLSFDPDGSFSHVDGVAYDITDRKRAEQLRIQHQKQLRHLAGRLASAHDEEQRRIAQGLHDDVAQLLVACSVKLGVAERAGTPAQRQAMHDEIDSLLKEANEKLRSLSFELSSSTLYRLGLRNAIHELCDTMCTRYGIRFSLKGDGPPEGLDAATATILFKAIRELLFNVVKHANVKEAWVCMDQSKRAIRLTVEDHGNGFPDGWADMQMNAGRGLGLFGISERLSALGGRMDIVSTPGTGARVVLWMPLGEEGKENDMRDPGRGISDASPTNDTSGSSSE